MLQIMNHYRKYLPAVVGGTVVVLGILIWMFALKTSAYAVYIDGEEKLYVKSIQSMEETTTAIEKDSEKQYDRQMKIGNEIKYEKTRVFRSKVTPEDELKKVLAQELDVKTMAAAINVNGKAIAYMDSKKAAEGLLQGLKEQYSKVGENETLVKVEFGEKIAVIETLVEADKVLSKEDTFNLITTGSPDPQKYVVKDGDCLWLIARANDMYVDDIVEANQLKSENLSLGQELILEKRKPLINVLSSVKGEKIEAIPYETKVITDKSSPYSIKVTQAGQEGSKQIAYTAEIVNGVEQEKEILAENIIKEPVTKVLVKGTKVVQVASRGGGGQLDWPVYGSISQYYKGSAHTGIDIAASKRTPLHAADSGYVTYAGYQGGYGNFVIINHNNGIVTRYAHCDSIAVSLGQKVSRGQVIAYLGSTGRSTGPHCHFEVLVNGSFQNPLNYLR